MTEPVQRPGCGDARHAAQVFGVTRIDQLEPLVGGHINESFYLRGNCGEWLLQWLNPAVFTALNAVQSNVEVVLGYLAAHDGNSGWPRLQRSPDGALAIMAGRSGLWRAYDWLGGRQALLQPRTPVEAREGGAAFAHFASALQDLQPEQLCDVLPGFHDLEARLQQLQRAQRSASAARLAASGDWRQRVWQQAPRRLARAPQARRRVIHGDTKFANLLFDADSGSALAIDYDTVMAGPLAWDFGDMLRSIASGARESEAPPGPRLQELLEACARGYLAGVRSWTSLAERRAMKVAPAYMAFMLGVRFLTDYLAGDLYFRIQHDQHNLDRARHQLQLADRLQQFEPLWGRLL